ncbi:thiolase family protein [Pseudomaricurvus alkylphenolicus]|uniref:thiolase family protein n=1 Tax=Pseudomaricurvus alkylphenolicus TaxID=1306991 RepID=UPI0014224BA5|nr:thiolase family protein [Pseudomaricurvus alkylphenolicus]NIB38055.1 thiolase family protein [Pseudomaricurvus alkylphenolicus]
MSKGLAIVGIAEVPTKRDPERTRWDILLEVCVGAVRDAGIDKNEINAVISPNPMAQPEMQNDMALGKIPDVLGLKGCRDICIANAGGTSNTNCLRLAQELIDSGQANFVLIPHTTVQSDMPPADLINFFATAPLDKQWEYPWGVSFNGSMGLITNRYMYETGASQEQMAAVTVGLRAWAAMDPMSIFYGKPLTLDDVLESRMVSTPLHARECNLLADGGGAMVVTSHEIARQMGDGRHAYKLGHGTRFTSAAPFTREDIFFRESYRASSQDALKQAGMTIDDIDLRQIYGAYPFTQCSALEGYGAVPENQGAIAWAEGRCGPGGDLPCTTMGDAIGRGHTGSGVSMAFYIDCVRQIRGEAGERQIQNCNNVIVTTSGGSGMNTCTTVFGSEPR